MSVALTPRQRAEAAGLRLLLSLPERVQRALVRRPVEVQGQRLDPEVQLLLWAMQQSGSPPFETLPLAEARHEVDVEAAMAAGRPLPVAETRTVDAGGRPGRLYLPDSPGGALLVYFHGGGGVLGSLESHDQTCRFLAREGRIAVLAVDYRLAPEAPFPAGVEDALSAHAWAREHAAELGGDPERVAVGGDSAGGNLAAVVAANADPAPAMQLLIYPVCDFSQKRESYRLFREGFFLTEHQMDWYRDRYLPDEDAARDPRASPLLADDLSGASRAYVALAGFDPLRDEGLAYARRLEEAGVETTLVVHEGLVHGFANLVTLGRAAPAAMRAAAGALSTV